MIRTQIYITPEQDKFLRDEAHQNYSSKSDEIRKAIDFYRAWKKTEGERKK